jgi:hypothetical protein
MAFDALKRECLSLQEFEAMLLALGILLER